MSQVKDVKILIAVVVLATMQLVCCSDSDKWCSDWMIMNDDQCIEAHFEREANYETAKEICKENSGQVALGSSSEIRNLLTRVALKHKFENYWIETDENTNSDQCQAIMHRNDFEISNEHCNNAMFYICQFDSEVSNSIGYESQYFKFSGERRKFSETKKSCENLGGKVAKLENVGVFNFILSEINNDKTWERLAIWQMEELHLSFSANIWAGAKENSEKCLIFDKNSLAIADCDEYHYFFCQYPAENKLSPLQKSVFEWSSIIIAAILVTLSIPFLSSNFGGTKSSVINNNIMKILLPCVIFMAIVAASRASEFTTCENGKFRFHGDACYEPRMKRGATYENAQEICLDSKAKLAVIRDYSTQEFLNRIAMKAMYENFWVGNANASSKDCIAMKSQDDYALDADHRDQNFFYVCELDECISSLTTEEFNNKCYEMVMERSKYSNAKKSCAKKGGNLAVIDTEQKLQFIQNLIYTNEWWTVVPKSVFQQLYFSDIPIFWAGKKFESKSQKWTSLGGTQDVDGLFYDYLFSDSDLESHSSADYCVTSEFQLADCDSYKYFFCEYSQDTEVYIVPMSLTSLCQSINGSVAMFVLIVILMTVAVIAIFIFILSRLLKSGGNTKG